MEKKRKIDIFKENMERMGNFVKKYIILYVLMLSLVIIFELVFLIYFFCNFHSFSFTNIVYLVSYLFLVAASLISIIVLLLSKKGKTSSFSLGILLHAYSLAIIIWATTISLLDLRHNSSPIVLLTISMVLSGILVISPIYFTIINLAAIISIIIYNAINNYGYFDGPAAYLNFFIFVIMVIIMAFRHYSIRMSEAKMNDYLRKLSYRDHLTGLGNETAYFEEVDKLMKALEKVDLKYAIVVMDVNNVKTTNDTYGHRFGCHLIVECGHMLPTIFKTSRLFHIGGDEFVAIVIGDDYDNLGSIIEDFDKKMRYSKIEFENHELTYSVARGYCFKKPGMTYKEVFQEADERMYENKKEVKKQYNLIIRER